MEVKIRTEKFIEKSKEIHKNKYKYSNVNYLNTKTKVKIICPIHGEFEQRPNDHLNGFGCSKCSGNKRLTSNEFIKNAKEKYKNKYDYSLVNYINNKTKVKIICPIHGKFETKPNDHLNGSGGCPKCHGRNKTTDDFIEDSNLIHFNKYDYSITNYENVFKKVKIICPTHGEFQQTPNNHLSGSGCPVCKESKGECEIRFKLEEKNIRYIRQKRFPDCKYKYTLPFDFYLPDYNICIEFHGLQHYQPISFFGGEDVFLNTQIRDKIKEQYCNEKNIKFIVIKYSDNINEKLRHVC